MADGTDKSAPADAGADTAGALNELEVSDDVARFRTVEIRLLERSLLELRCTSPTTIDDDILRFTLAAQRALCAAPRQVLLVHAANIRGFTFSAWRQSESVSIKGNVRAQAVLLNSPIARKLLAMRHRINPPRRPFKAFEPDEREAALAWLREQRDQVAPLRSATPTAPWTAVAIGVLGLAAALLMLGASHAALTLTVAGVAGLTWGLTSLRRWTERQRDAYRGELEVLQQENQRLTTDLTVFDSLLENAVEGVVTMDGRGHIHSFNKAATQLFGYTVDEVFGKNVNMLMPEPYHSAHDGYLARYAQTKERRIIGIGREVMGRHKSGDVFPVRLSVTESHDPHLGTLYTGLLVDLTDLRAAEQEAQERARRLEEANQDLESFARAMSHDLRSPLRGMQQLATWIREDLGDDTPADVKEHLALLQDRARRLDNMIGQLHRFARVGADLTRLEEPINPTELVEDVLDQLAVPERFEVKVSSDVPTLVQVRAALVLLVQNLVQNAIRHHHAEEGYVWVSFAAEESRVVLRVEDDGPGIPTKHRARVFEPLETLRPRDDGGGSGLGLSLVKRTVERLGGTIDLRESAHGGACFEICLPNLQVDEPVSGE